MRLIIVDGLDGVGKDTHALRIKERYEALGGDGDRPVASLVG